MVVAVFWRSYIVLVFGLFIWLAEHPLRVGALILFLYIMGRVLVRFSVRFVVGVFLFLTGVRGIIVAFLYVVALCPNPVFTDREGDGNYTRVALLLIFFSFLCPLGVLVGRRCMGFGEEVRTLRESLQWSRDPSMCAGLAELIPFLGFLLFLCMVRVVILCGQQKQCLGGHGLGSRKRAYV